MGGSPSSRPHGKQGQSCSRCAHLGASTSSASTETRRALASRLTIAGDAPRRPASMLERCGWLTPASRPSSLMVRPERSRIARRACRFTLVRLNPARECLFAEDWPLSAVTPLPTVGESGGHPCQKRQPYDWSERFGLRPPALHLPGGLDVGVHSGREVGVAHGVLHLHFWHPEAPCLTG
jgi:hypothetical protein